MKALVYWCRWHEARLRLHGRDDDKIWGELVFAADARPFRYELATRRLFIGDDPPRQLDDKGVEQPPGS